MVEVMFQSVDFLRVSANFLEYLKINSNSRKVPGIPGNNGRESLVSRFPSNSWKIRVISGNHGSSFLNVSCYYYVLTKWLRVFHSGSLCCLILRSASAYFHTGSVCSLIKGKSHRLMNLLSL